jgi:hypothetical protein
MYLYLANHPSQSGERRLINLAGSQKSQNGLIIIKRLKVQTTVLAQLHPKSHSLKLFCPSTSRNFSEQIKLRTISTVL